MRVYPSRMTNRAAFPGGPTFSTVANRFRGLRKTKTDAEFAVSRLVRERQLGVRFRRQPEFGPFVLDFFCAEALFGVELDWGKHDSNEALPEGEAW